MPARKPAPPPKRRELGSVYYSAARASWVAELEDGVTAAGKRRKRRKFFKGPESSRATRLEAEQALAELLTDSGRGLLADPSSVTVGQWLRQSLERRNRTGANTTRTENTRLMGLALRTLDTQPLSSITPLMVRRMVDSLSDTAHRTQLKALSIVRTALEEAADLELIPRNPATSVKAPRGSSEPAGRALSIEEVRRFLEHSKLRRTHTLFYLMLSTGLRIGEAMALKLEDLDLERSKLQVRRSASGRGRNVEITPGKTPSARRTVPVSSALSAALTVWLERLDKERREGGGLYQVGDWLFPSSAGTLLEYENLKRDIKAICLKAGLEPLTSHDFRRTYITLAAKQGISLEVIAKLVGHKNVKLILEIYRRVDDTEAAAGVLELV